jgi:thiamine biosynthesis lipoprotein
MIGALERTSFRAMGTACEVAASAGGRDASATLAAARAEVHACEHVLSRFDPQSDLWRLNESAGAWVEVDARLVQALQAALRGRNETCGVFDPSILPALEALGYDRSVELLSERDAVSLEDWRAGARIEVHPEARRARVESGVDLGGLGKGLAAERALDAMREASPSLTGALVDLGGDIAVWGTPPGGGPWRIDVADPRRRGGVAGTLELDGGGVATSGRDTRRFGPRRQLHHLVDPATGIPAASGPLAVTVVAPTATDAEIYATAFAVAGLAAARELAAARRDIAALFVPRLGEPVAIGDLPLARAPIVVDTKVGRFTWH